MPASSGQQPEPGAEPGPGARDLWDDLLPVVPLARPPGDPVMLRLIAYDISEPRRLHRVATVCEDYGVRVQKSLFECWLEDDEFEQLWAKLQATFDPETDRLVAYLLDRGAVGRRRTAGDTMVVTHRAGCYVV